MLKDHVKVHAACADRTRHTRPDTSPRRPRGLAQPRPTPPPGDKLGGSGTALPLDATREKDYACRTDSLVGFGEGISRSLVRVSPRFEEES